VGLSATIARDAGDESLGAKAQAVDAGGALDWTTMGGLFESDEATKPRVRVALLTVARRLVLALFAWWAGNSWYSITQAIDYLVRWVAGDSFPIDSTISLILRFFALLAAGSALATLAGLVRERPRVPRGAVAVRVDERELHAGEQLVVARADVAGAEVATDVDLGFALVVTTRAGATVRIPQRSESSARGLAAALGAESGAVVFEGVAGGRSRQTRAAALGATSVVVTLVLMMVLGWMSADPRAWRWFDGWRAEIPFTFAWWLDIVCTLGIFPAGVALAAALGPITRRARTGSVTVGPAGVETRDRTIAPHEIAGVEAGTASDVTLALRDGKKVRLAFGAERALVERDLFVARVRELAEAPTGEVTYPAAETSGVRVALSAEPLAEAEDEDVEAPARKQRGVR
jgi:hypothetical protein